MNKANARRRVAWALPLLILCGSAPAAGASWRELLNQAERLSREGKSEESLAAAQDVLADAEKSLGPEAPELGNILSRLSHIYEMTGADERLPEMEKRLAAVKSKDFGVWFALGSLLRREGRPLEAANALKKALAFKPDEPFAEYELAKAYDDLGRFEEEAALLKKRVEKKSRDYFIYSQLAIVYTRLGRFAEAKEAFARAKKSGGKIAGAYVAEGYFYLHSGHPAQAEKAFDSAVAVDSASPVGYHHMGVYLNDKRRYPEAEKYFRRALEILEADPNAAAVDVLHARGWLGNVVEAQGRYAEAEALYLKNLEKTRPGGDFQLAMLKFLARLYVAQGKSAQAEETYKRAAAECRVRFKCRFALGGEALIDLGQFYRGQGRRAEAEDAAERAEKFSEDAPIAQRFDLLRDLAALYSQLGDVSKRDALYGRLMPMRRTMPLDPDLVWVETGLAEIAAAHGRFHEAEDFYRQAMRILGHNSYWKKEADMLDKLAALYIQEGEPQRAADEAREQAQILRARP